MIRPTKQVVMWGAASAAALGYGCLIAEPGTLTRVASVIGGLSGLACTAVVWSSLEKDATRNPEVMNAHFVTGGALSAIDGDPAEIELLRGVFYRRVQQQGERGLERANRIRKQR
ncbi:MAG: hypothetical protein ABIR60_08655 [Allosphingosinicella sp.]